MAFEFRETMAGSYHLLDRPLDERPLSFSLRARSHRMGSFLAEPVVDIVGEVDAEGFADHRPLRGTLGLLLLRSRQMPYSFAFTGNDGLAYRFEGTKNVSLLALAETMTTLPGAIVEAGGREIGRALVRFDMRRDLVKFLRSWHLV